ncbi:hypothetical protein R3P38DRAFT_2647329 [Favolaschia claudopus]|uniref:Uncharacterized protein n=1 Tax=Favolaschia claudopus TaxID=2862362 RepID=A0AAW0AA41_9AGAR
MGLPDAYRPDETPAQIFSEHTWLQGVFLACVAYGMVALLFFQCIDVLLFTPTRKPSRCGRALACYIGVLFGLSTVYIGALIQFTQLAFIDGRNIPGGPNEFENEMFNMPVDMLANVTMTVLSWLSDLINIWRCYVIYQSSSIPGLAIIAFPMAMLVASIAVGIAWLKQVGTPDSSPWAVDRGFNFTTLNFSLSLALNILTTLLIVVRLLLFRRRINQALPSGTSHGSEYVSLAAIVFESAAIYSVFSLLFLVPFSLGHPLSQLFIQALSPVQIMSSLLIIFRIAQGKAWSPGPVEISINGTQDFQTSIRTIGGSNRTRSIRTTTETSTADEDRRKEISMDFVKDDAIRGSDEV